MCPIRFPTRQGNSVEADGIATLSNTSFLLPLSLLICLGTVRGGVTSLAKFVAIHDIHPLGYTFWQCAVAGTLLLVLVAIRGQRLALDGPHLRFYAVCGLIGSAVPNTVFFYVVKFIPAGTMAVILVTVPLLTYFFAIAARLESVDLRRAAGIGLGLVGALFIVLPKGNVSTTGLTIYFAIAFLCPMLYSLTSIVASRTALPPGDSIARAAGTLIAATLFLLPVMLVTDSFHPIWRNADFVDAMILLHGLAAATAYSMFFVLIKIAGPVYYSQSAYLIALTGIGWGMLVFGEDHAPWFWLAVLFIFAGLLLVNMRPQRMVDASESRLSTARGHGQ